MKKRHGMIDWLIAKIKYNLSTDWCYDMMEKDGYATNGCCRGTAGGTRHTNYLSEMCIDCKYFDWSSFIGKLVKRGKE